MANLKEVRSRINSVKSTQQITKAMKMVAAAKLRKAQDGIIQMRPYAQLLNSIIQNLSASGGDGEITSVFTENREPNKVLIVTITSDRGLCGAFNTNVIKASANLAQEKYAKQLANGNVSFLNIGNKGYDAIRRRGFVTNGQFVSIFHNLNFNKVKETAEFILESFKNKEIDRVELIYNEFKNVATQIVRTHQFLPIVETAKPENQVKTNNTNYILEPSQEEIILELIPKSLKIQLYRAVLESNASEHGARMTAMDKATENADTLVKELTLVYNRTRQAAITKEILEIVGGAEALKAN